MKRYLVALLFLVTVACQAPPVPKADSKTTTFQGSAMTIAYKVMVGKKLDAAQQKHVSSIINQTFNETDVVFNRYNPLSEISRINKMPADQEALLSPNLEKLLKISNELFQLTEGRFDPTVLPLVLLWGDKLDKGQTPTAEEIAAVEPAVGWDKIHFKEGIIFKDDSRTALDLGGVAKGYCVDLITERLHAAGFTDVYVEWGGEIRAAGHHPDDRDWVVALSALGNPTKMAATIPLYNKAVATSGDYLQYWEVDNGPGKEPSIYFHVINPRTHRPMEVLPHSVASATVIAETCAMADGLATAAMIFSDASAAEAWAKQVQKKIPHLTFWMISREEHEMENLD